MPTFSGGRLAAVTIIIKFLPHYSEKMRHIRAFSDEGEFGDIEWIARKYSECRAGKHRFAPVCIIPGCDAERKRIRPDLFKRPGRCEFCSCLRLESLLYSNVPEPAFDRGKRFVVTVLKVAGHEWRIFVGHVLHSKRNRGVI